jgi:hypothetical protein
MNKLFSIFLYSIILNVLICNDSLAYSIRETYNNIQSAYDSELITFNEYVLYEYMAI